jgi:hypothetical protein
MCGQYQRRNGGDSLDRTPVDPPIPRNTWWWKGARLLRSPIGHEVGRDGDENEERHDYLEHFGPSGTFAGRTSRQTRYAPGAA